MATKTLNPQRALTRDERRVLAGTLVGTTIEWYDFFIYAQAAGLVFAQLYFAPMGQEGGVWPQMVAWASLGVSFLFRPLGAVVAGYLGDRFGRKGVLIFTLVLMGTATSLIGLLPTYEQWGITAPLLLILMRIIQGISAGGEWGGAVLMAVEHAPTHRRGFFGAYPQIGVPAGMVLATFIVFVVTSLTTDEQFLAWGWRVTFLLSLVLIVIGYFIRRAVSESPVFEEMVALKHESATPLKTLFKNDSKNIVLAALSHIGSSASGYLFIAFFSSYAIRTHGMDQSRVLLASTFAALFWLAFTLYGGSVSDRIGRTKALRIGYTIMFVWMIPLVLLIDTGNIWLYALGLVVFTIGNGLTYGPLSAMYAELFPARVRYSGISISYAIGAVFGGAFAPMIAESLLGSTGSSLSIALYIMVLFVASYIGTSLIKEPRGAELRAR
ncbi:MFS transporter [Arthrobacter sp. Marseille-P9274]|uniref:MFS transporter n=1 Tax=Arthrobacter sp. Marseille-P9274 TaxID=2866572 RepID=UPI0021C9811A|nr:MFS transporter [Arthrobacter sp. Marseille-P9274]